MEQNFKQPLSSSLQGREIYSCTTPNDKLGSLAALVDAVTFERCLEHGVFATGAGRPLDFATFGWHGLIKG